MAIPTHIDNEFGRAVAIVPAIQQHEIKPTLCFWWAVHPDGKDESFFTCPLQNEHVSGFTDLTVFSMSNYLRSLTEDEIVLDMPSASRRIEWLNRLFG